MTISQQDITKAFIAAGCEKDDTVMFHSSLKSLGYVEGGAAAVYNAVLDAVGPKGTVAVPSLWYNGNPQECPKEKFDVKTSPTYVGTIPETFRNDPRALRSDNFSHAVCAIGARADELTRDHGKGRQYPSPWSDKAFSEISPWSKFYEWNTLYCFIGVDMNTCTMKHCIESRYIDELLNSLPENRRSEFSMQLSHNCESRLWIFYPGAKMRERLEEKNLVKRTPIGETTLLSIRTRPMFETVLEILRSEPQNWCTPEFYQWICEVKNAAK